MAGRSGAARRSWGCVKEMDTMTTRGGQRSERTETGRTELEKLEAGEVY